ncbi:MAG TPA: hypothetical protein VM925_22610 [Labilithrix sp.]|jgi:hypothetical protein|nr:hypothetical protein [Labilithrix sp.]
MSSKLFLGLSVLTACAVACTGTLLDAGGEAPGAIDADASDAPVTCGSEERLFNGICRTICRETTACPRGTRCVSVENEASLCLDPESASRCAYLDSDTQCYGAGTYAYTKHSPRGSYEAYDRYASDPYNASPYDLSPYTDPFFSESSTDNRSTPPSYFAGCVGNADWVSVPLPSEGIACASKHQVIRCVRAANRCELRSGWTRESPSPY